MERLEAGRLLMILVCFLTRVALSSPPLGELVRSFKHLHQEGVDGRVADQFEEEQVLQALQADGAQCWKPEEELCEPEQWANGVLLDLIGFYTISVD